MIILTAARFVRDVMTEAFRLRREMMNRHRDMAFEW
jgi:hypothetical protein